MALSREEIEVFRRDLFARREAMVKDLRQSIVDFVKDDSTYSDTVDQASVDMDRTLSLQLKSRDRTILFQIDAAINRLNAGSYGTCEQCEDAIAEARIHAFPFTTLCIECKAELESEAQRYPGRM